MEYTKAVWTLAKIHDNIRYELKEHQNFLKLFQPQDWAAIIRTYNAFPKSYKSSEFQELVKIAEEHLRNVEINTDPCKKLILV
jgi:hypothetical protein